MSEIAIDRQPMLRLGDMVVEQRPPAKLIKALAVIATHLHQAYDRERWIVPGKSRHSCVLVSLTVRDFLWKVGFKDAKVVPCYLLVRLYDSDDRDLWSVGVGDHERVEKALVGRKFPPVQLRDEPGGGWAGHAVTAVPSAGYFIDATLYQSQRDKWWPNLPGMAALRLDPEPQEVFPGMPALGGFISRQPEGRRAYAAWISQPWNTGWKHGPDAERLRRFAVVNFLRKAFGQWSDE